jgi:hypothetical protein
MIWERTKDIEREVLASLVVAGEESLREEAKLVIESDFFE